MTLRDLLDWYEQKSPARGGLHSHLPWVIYECDNHMHVDQTQAAGAASTGRADQGACIHVRSPENPRHRVSQCIVPVTLYPLSTTVLLLATFLMLGDCSKVYSTGARPQQSTMNTPAETSECRMLGDQLHTTSRAHRSLQTQDAFQRNHSLRALH